METEHSPTDTDERLAGLGGRRRLPTLLSVAAIAVGGLGVAACGEEDSAGGEQAGGGTTAEETAAEPEELAGEVTLSELLENPDQYVGEIVTVSGQVTDQEVDGVEDTPAAFTLGEDLDQDLLVLPQSELTPEGITDESVLRVEGMVMEVSDTIVDEADFLFEEEAAIEDDGFLDDYDGEVAIAATSIDTDIPQTDETQDDEAVEEEAVE